MDPADHQPQTIRLRQPAGSQHFAEPFAFGLVVTGDQYLVRFRNAVQFILDLGDIAAETLDRFDAQMANRLHAGAGNRGQTNTRKARELSNRPCDGKEPSSIRHPLKIMLSLFMQVFRLHQHGPGFIR